MVEGTKVIVGTKGYSAADIARQNGWEGTDAEFHESLTAAARGFSDDAAASAITSENAKTVAEAAATAAKQSEASSIAAADTASGYATTAVNSATSANNALTEAQTSIPAIVAQSIADDERIINAAVVAVSDAVQDLPVATPDTSGFMSATDKTKVDATLTSEEILAGYVSRGTLVFSVTDYGAKVDSVADDTAAWVAAEDAAFKAGPNARLFAPSGIYRTTGPIQVRCSLDADQATIRYYGAGQALVIGDESAPGKVTPRKRFKLPRVINMSRGSSYWDGTSIGVKLVNLDTCNLYVPFVQDFEQGLVLSGYSAGVAYCNITLGALWDNHKNLVLTNDTTGWANQNNFFGGRLNQTLWKGAFLDDPDANQLSMISDTTFGGPNNNNFYGTSFEGVNISLDRIDMSGKYNHFYNCRYENFGTPFRVRYRDLAEWNRILGGYGSGGIIEVFDGTRGGGAIDDPLGSYTLAQNTAGQVIPNAVNTTIKSWGTPTGRRIPYAANTGEFTPRPGRWLIMVTVTFAPKATGRRIARIKYGTETLDVAEAPGTTGSTERITLKLNTSFKSDGVKKLIVECNQTSGNDLALESSAWYVKFQAEYLGG